MAKVAVIFLYFYLYLLSQRQSQGVTAAMASSSVDPNANADADADADAKAFSFPSSDFTIIPLHGGGRGNGIVSSMINGSISINSGLVLYRHPVKFSGFNGFSTYFSFSPPRPNAAALTFFLTLPTISLDLLPGPPPSILSLSFISNSMDGRLHIRVAGFVDAPLAHQDHYFLLNNKNNKNNNSNAPLHSWIDYYYDAALTNRRLEVRLSRSDTANTAATRPESSILSYPLDLSAVLSRETMLVGFASTRNCTLYHWTFVARHQAPFLMHSQPLDPNKFSPHPDPAENPSHRHRPTKSHPWGLVLALIFAAACGAMVTFFAIFVWFSVCAHRPIAPVEYPVHPVDVVYEKIVLVSLKDPVHNK